MTSTNVVAVDVSVEVWKRVRRSYAKKGTAAVAIVVSLAILSGLHSQHDDARWRQATRFELTDKLRKLLPSELQKSKAHPAASTAELFDEMYSKSPVKEGFDKAREKDLEGWLTQKKSIDTAFATLTSASEKNASALAALAYARATADLERASIISRRNSYEGESRAELKRKFDKLHPDDIARPENELFGSRYVWRLRDDLLDEKHPLYTIYEVTWTAALIVAVLSFVYLILAPIFRFLPFSGSEEELSKRFEDLFTRKETESADSEGVLKTLMRGGAGIGSVVIISAAAVGGTALSSTSSPWTNLTSPAAIHRSEIPSRDVPATSTSEATTDAASKEHPPLPPPSEPKPPDGNGNGKGGDRNNGNQVPSTGGDASNPSTELAELRGKIEALSKDLEPVRTAVDKVTKEELPAVNKALEGKSDKTYVDKADTAVLYGSEKSLSNHKKDEDKKIDGVNGALNKRITEASLAAVRPPLLERILNRDKYRVTQLAADAAKAKYGDGVGEAVQALVGDEQRTKTRIEWDLQSALVAKIGADETRNLLSRITPMVIRLSNPVK